MTNSDPPQGIVTGSIANLQITVTDPNVGDGFTVRWIAEYPPYNRDRTRKLRDFPFQPSLDGRPLQKTVIPDGLDCLSLSQGALHPVTALVADRDFLTLADHPELSPEELLTALPSSALTVEAHWVLNMQCGQ